MRIFIYENDALLKLREREGEQWFCRQMIREPQTPNFYNLKSLWDHYIYLHRKDFLPATDGGLLLASREISIDPYLASSDKNRFYKLKYNGQLMCFGKINSRG